MRYAKGVLCVSFTQTAVYPFFYQLRQTYLCEGHPKRVNLLLWAQNGPIGKTSHKKKQQQQQQQNRSQDRYDRRGESAR